MACFSLFYFREVFILIILFQREREKDQEHGREGQREGEGESLKQPRSGSIS